RLHSHLVPVHAALRRLCKRRVGSARKKQHQDCPVRYPQYCHRSCPPSRNASLEVESEPDSAFTGYCPSARMYETAMSFDRRNLEEPGAGDGLAVRLLPYWPPVTAADTTHALTSPGRVGQRPPTGQPRPFGLEHAEGICRQPGGVV